MIVVLAGGTGGAKLAAGLHDLVGDELTVIANTGDDLEFHGVHVSPDPDLVSYWLAGTIDERGWGIRDDSFEVMDALATAGRPAWFRLGDRDLAMCLIRTELLRGGSGLTDAHAAVTRSLGLRASVLPMCEEPVRTHVRVGDGWRGFQEFMIVDRAAGPIEAIELRGAEAARPSAAVLAAIASAELIVVGPSNPVISIGPILALPGMRDALSGAAAPVVAVSPFVGGRALKGPTEAFMAHAGYAPGAAGAASAYAGLLDGMIADEPRRERLPWLETNTLMDDAASRRRLATEVLAFGLSLRG
ncbi:MAG: 2-phospho-L-lactate transferase [Thermoleophilaceae bacterium]